MIAAGSLAATAVAVAAASALADTSPPGTVAIVAALGAVSFLALAFRYYEAAAVVGFLLLGVVRFEPAPSDLVFAFVIAIAAATGRFQRARIPGVVAALLVGFIVMNIVSFAAAPELQAAIRFFAITAYLAVFAVWLTTFVTSVRRARMAVFACTVAAGVLGVTSALALFASFPGSGQLIAEDSRALGLFKDPNVFAPFLVFPLLISVEEILRPRLYRSRWLAVAACGALSIGVLFAYSRAAWLNAVIGLVVLLTVVLMRRDGVRRALVGLGLVSLVSAVLVTVLAFTGSLSFLVERAQLQPYDANRFAVQDAGLRLAQHHLLGVGPGQFDVFAGAASHSLYIRALAEQGIFGLVVLLALVAATLWFAVRNVVEGRDTYAIGSAALLAAWCGLLANGFFIDTLHWRHFWIVAALIWVAAARRDIPPRRSPGDAR